jgi:hypothetical protein
MFVLDSFGIAARIGWHPPQPSQARASPWSLIPHESGPFVSRRKGLCGCGGIAAQIKNRLLVLLSCIPCSILILKKRVCKEGTWRGMDDCQRWMRDGSLYRVGLGEGFQSVSLSSPATRV